MMNKKNLLEQMDNLTKYQKDILEEAIVIARAKMLETAQEWSDDGYSHMAKRSYNRAKELGVIKQILDL